MQICPKCGQYTLGAHLRNSVALCYNLNCDFEEKIKGFRDYFERFEISELNWPNYCAQTPPSMRVLEPFKQGKF
jgi:hypothetical protein